MRNFYIILAVLFLVNTGFSGESLKKTVNNYPGSGRPRSLYSCFRKMVGSCGGAFALSVSVIAGRPDFIIPELYPAASTVDDTFEKFCNLFPGFTYRIRNGIVNLYPSGKMDSVRGDGRLLTPDQWIVQGAALGGKKVKCFWQPVDRHKGVDFRIPLYRAGGDSSEDAAAAFCGYFTDYEVMRRGGSIYIFPKGQWTKMAGKYNERTVLRGKRFYRFHVYRIWQYSRSRLRLPFFPILY